MAFIYNWFVGKSTAVTPATPAAAPAEKTTAQRLVELQKLIYNINFSINDFEKQIQKNTLHAEQLSLKSKQLIAKNQIQAGRTVVAEYATVKNKIANIRKRLIVLRQNKDNLEQTQMDMKVLEATKESNEFLKENSELREKYEQLLLDTKMIQDQIAENNFMIDAIVEGSKDKEEDIDKLFEDFTNEIQAEKIEGELRKQEGLPEQPKIVKSISEELKEMLEC